MFVQVSGGEVLYRPLLSPAQLCLVVEIALPVSEVLPDEAAEHFTLVRALVEDGALGRL
ncbi:hypothetical protein ACIP4Y_35405 [Streptomyces sp. NPDC088810]|uniref:hypothetical protein n=1 Tax=Streptomyces sp. NPDC088810 TaxID=3365904 RepID=UPI0037FC21AA